MCAHSREQKTELIAPRLNPSGISRMQSFYGDTEESTEDIPGHKKSKRKSLKTRIFGKSKRAGEEGTAKLSQSAGDITAGDELGSGEDLACSQGMMGSRALSHDSIFLADQVLTDAEPARVLSQENVHSKIKALQMKLQLQKMHFGPPPMVLPIRQHEDHERRYEDDDVSHSPPEISGGDIITQEAISKTIYQPISYLLTSIPKPEPAKSVTLTPPHPMPPSVSSNSSSAVVEPPLDFSSPAKLTTRLDTSAARHRMSIKPKNQRVSTKRRATAPEPSSVLAALNNTDRTKSVREKEQQLSTQEEVTLETEQEGIVIPITPQHLPSKPPDVTPITSEATSKSSDPTNPQHDQALPVRFPPPPTHVHRVKPHKPADVMTSERPHSSFIPSELKTKREGAVGVQVMSHEEKNTQDKPEITEDSTDQVSTTFSPVVIHRSSSVRQQIQGETESTRGIDPTNSQHDQALPVRLPPPTTHVHRVKPHKPADVMTSERPHSSFIPSELKTKREGAVGVQVMSYREKNTQDKPEITEDSTYQVSTTFSPVVIHRSSSVRQQIQGETESTRGIDPTNPQHEQALPVRLPPPTTQVLRVKPHKPADVMTSERPHSSFIPSELKTKRERAVGIQVMSHEEKNTQDRPEITEDSTDQVSTTFSQGVIHRSSSVRQQIQGETESTRGIDPTNPQHEQALPMRLPPPPTQVLRVKPHKPADVMTSERPHSSFIPSELKTKREGAVGVQVMSHEEKNTQDKPEITEDSTDQVSTTFSPVVILRSSSVRQQIRGETESTRGIKRHAPGSGSFHFSITPAKNRDVERPRSGSFVGVLEQTETQHKVEDKPNSSMKEKAELKDFQPRGGPIAVGRPREEKAQHKISVLPWEKRDSFKKPESVSPSKTVIPDTGITKEKELESSQEAVEEAVEAKEIEEDEGKTPFGVKLRSTSQSMRIRYDVSPRNYSKPPVSEEQSDKQKTQETSNNVSHTYKKLSTNISSTPSAPGDLQPTDPAPSGFSFPVKHNLPLSNDQNILPEELQTTSSNPKEDETVPTAPQKPQPAPQTAPPEVSWMSLAMEKTRSLQQLFTSRFPRDFTGAHTAARPRAQVQTTSQTDTPTEAQTQTQTIIIQETPTPPEAADLPSTDTVKAETVQSRSQTQTFKPSLMAAQQKTSVMSPVHSNASREPQTSKQTNEPQSHPDATQSAPQSASVQTNQQATQSPSHSYAQTQASSQSAQGSVTQSVAQSYLSFHQQQPPWSNRGLYLSNQLKSTTSAPTSVSTTPSAPAPSPVTALEKEESEPPVREKGGASLLGRRVIWTGSASDRALFLERRAEWSTPSGTKGVEVKKIQTEAQTSDESPTSAKATPLSYNTKPEGIQEEKPAESSPTKVADKPLEDKWSRKNVAPPSSPSFSPTMPSALQSVSDSGQPSWMELAKRKSMAWNDKSMD